MLSCFPNLGSLSPRSRKQEGDSATAIISQKGKDAAPFLVAEQGWRRQHFDPVSLRMLASNVLDVYWLGGVGGLWVG